MPRHKIAVYYVYLSMERVGHWRVGWWNGRKWNGRLFRSWLAARMFCERNVKKRGGAICHGPMPDSAA